MATEAPSWAPPLMAVQFLTRLPVPGVARLDAAQARTGLSRAMAWLPLAGALIGCVTAGVFVVARMLWPASIAAIVALIVEARLTGAFHEDAVADFCDGFGGGATAEDVHRILKDSRIGSYGALGLALAVLLRIAATATLPGHAFAAIVAAATMGRLWAVAVMATVPPAPGGSGVARVAGTGSARLLLGGLAAALPGIVPLALTAPGVVAATVAAGLVFVGWFGRLLRRRIGGGTGDCLGFAAYAGQLALLLAAAAAAAR